MRLCQLRSRSWRRCGSARMAQGSSSWSIGRISGPGRKIRVLEGVFADCLGLYDGMPDRDRVAVLLDLLGRKVRVMVDVETVAAA